MAEYDLMRYRWLLLPFSLLLVLAIILFHFVSSLYPERIGFYILQKIVRKSEGTLNYGTIRGDIRKGLTFEDVSFTSPEASLTARSVTIRMRTAPLLFGVVSLKELTIEGAQLFLKNREDGKTAPENPIPLWLTLYSKNTSIGVDRIEIGNGGGLPFILEKVRLEASAAVRFGRVNFGDLRLSAGKNPLGIPASFNGSLGVKPGKWLNCSGFFSAGGSRGGLSANYRMKGGTVHLIAEIKKSTVLLKDLKAIAEFPDLSLACTAKITLEGNKAKLKAEIEEKGYGKFAFDSEGTLDGDILRGKGKVSAMPFFYSLGIPQVKSDKLKIFGDFDSEFEYRLSQRKLKCLLQGKIRDSEALNIPIASGDANVAVEGTEVRIVSTFSSRLAGRGTVEVAHDFESFLTNVRFSSAGILSRSTVDALGITVPLPYPLSFNENSLTVKGADLLFDGDNVNVDLSATDNREGSYKMSLFFRNLEIHDLKLGLAGIEPGMWGFETPFRFSGNLGFDFTVPEHTPATLVNGFFDFADGSLGPVTTNFKIMPSGVLIIPRTLVPFPGGSADVEGELAQDGRYKGGGTASVRSWDFLPEKTGAKVKGGLISSFAFEGDFSGIDISGSAKSPLLGCPGVEAENLEIRGSASLKPGASSFDLDCLSSGVASERFAAGATSLKVTGPLTSIKFDLSSSLAGDHEVRLGGVLNSGPGGYMAMVERGVIRSGSRNLYLSGTPEISLGRDLVEWKGVVLLSGESKASSDGKIFLSPGRRSIEAELSAENFSIILLPLPRELEDLRGKIDGTVRIEGQLDDPSLKGELLFKNLTFPLKESDYKIVGMAGLNLDGKDVRFANCYFSTNDGGDASLTGAIRMKGFHPEAFDLSLDATDFPVVYGRDFEGMMDVGLKLKGSWDQPHLDGTVHFLKGKLQLPEAVKNPQLPASITFINAKAEEKRLTARENAFLAKLRGGILFTSKGKVWISRNDMVGELGGRVLVKFTKEGLEPEGSLSVLAGRFLLQGSKFELKDSSLYFSGGRDLYPLLDIKASKDIDNYEVTVRLQGRVEKPTLSLSSIPPLEEGEVLSLILFGRTSQNLNPEEHARWGGAAAAIAFNYEATPVMKSVSKALKVDTLLVGASSTGDPQVGFSKYLSDRFVLEYQQIFGSLPESRVNLRYRINRHLSLDTISSTAGKSGADITWEQKY